MKAQFSIVIPTHSRPESLWRCLESLTRLDAVEQGFEVIVVDDGSEPQSDCVTSTFANRLNIKTLRQENTGPASARNTGAATAKGSHIIFTDDDCEMSSDYLTQLVSAVEQFPDAILGGRVENGLSGNLFAVASQLVVDYLCDALSGSHRSSPLVTSNNLVVPADGFQKQCGFDCSFPLAAGEDRDFCARWERDGRSVERIPQLVVNHFHQLSLMSFWRQHFNYGNGAFLYHQKRRDAGSAEGLSLKFYIGLVLCPLWRSPLWKAIPLCLLMTMSQLATVCGYVSTKYRDSESASILPKVAAP